MDKILSSFKFGKKTDEKHISALSWNIACEPKLYKQLASNPYSKNTQQIISERFPDESFSDIVQAINFAPFFSENPQKYSQSTRRELKISTKQFLNASFITLVVLLGFCIIQAQTTRSVQLPKAGKQILGVESQNTNENTPKRLIIPAINVDALIQQVGLTPNGTMDVPNNTVDVGWFLPGTIPGEQGNAVIDGHFDSEDGGPGVFTNLHKLKSGDRLIVEDIRGKSTTFVVRTSHIYDPEQKNDVFSQVDGKHLNLITCDGKWDEDTKSYTKRLVVFADILQ